MAAHQLASAYKFSAWHTSLCHAGSPIRRNLPTRHFSRDRALAVLWASSMRLRIEGDEVQVIYPFLGRWRNRAFRFGEIASVEVRVVNGRKEVRIVLHDCSSIRYMRWDERVIDELLGVLRRGVAEAKSAPLDWSELA